MDSIEVSLNIVSGLTTDQIKREAEEAIEQVPVMRLDLQKMILSYLLEYVKMIYKQALDKYPKDTQLSLQYQYFLTEHLHNCFMSINQSRLFDTTTLSTVEKLSYILNEAYQTKRLLKLLKDKKNFENGYKFKQYGIIYDDQQISKSSYQNGAIPDYMGEDQLDADHFIQVNFLSQFFYLGAQKLSFDVMDFWKALSDQSGDIDINKIQSNGNNVSERIFMVQKCFNKINNLAKYADYRLYQIYAIIQKLILSDNQAYDLYMNKMKSLITMQKLFKNNSMKFYSDTDLGMILVNSSLQDFGKIIVINQYLLKFLGYQTSEFKHQKIGILQPKLIRDNHESFVNRFISNGDTQLIHTLSNVFIVNKQGYVSPVQIYFGFHYSLMYAHTIIAFITPIYEMPLQRNGPKIQTSNIMFFLCDIHGEIFEMSESCHTILGVSNRYLSNNELRTDSDKLKMHDLIPDINFQKIREILPEENRHDSQNFEINCDINLDIISQLKSSEKSSIYRNRRGRAFALIMQERLGQGIVDMIVVAVKIQEETSQLGLGVINEQDVELEVENIDQSQDLRDQQNIQMRSQNESISSSNSYSHIEQDLIKQSLSGLGKQTPRSLKIIMQLMVLVFLIMVTISSINLFLVNQRSTQLDVEIQAFKFASQREGVNNRLRTILRSLSNMANGLEKTKFSFLSDDKYTTYNNRLSELTSEIKSIQKHLEQSSYEYSEDFRYMLDSENLLLQYLNEANQIVTSNHTLSFSVNLYTSRLLDISNLNQSQMKGNLSIQTLTPNKSKSYVPTDNERTFFFASENAKDAIRVQIRAAKDLYAYDITLHAEQSALSTQTTIIISICSILIVGIIVTPLLTRIVDRQYIALKFFISVHPETLVQLTQKCYQCLIEVNELLSLKSNNHSKHLTNGYGILANNETIPKSMRINDLSLSNISNEYSYSVNDYSRYQDKSISEMEELYIEPSTFKHQKQIRQNNEEEEIKLPYTDFPQDYDFASKIKPNTQYQSVKVQAFQKNYEMNKHSFNNNYDGFQLDDVNDKMKSWNNQQVPNIQKQFESQNDFQNQTKNIQSTENKLNTIEKIENKNDNEKQKQQQMTKEQIQKAYIDQFVAKLTIIKEAQFRRKIKVLVSCLVAVSLLSSYFIGSLFMSLEYSTQYLIQLKIQV
eukprot:403353053